MHSPRHLAAILRDTIRRVELSTDINPDDPSLVELKRILLLKIAALEAETGKSVDLPESTTQTTSSTPSKIPVDDMPKAAPLPSFVG